MTTFARVAGGYALDCQIAATATDLAARFNPEWLSANPFVIVPDGTLHGAVDNGNGTFTNPPPAIDYSTLPNNPGNPYFGKQRLAAKDFWALVGQSLPADRFKRLLNDSHFLWVNKVIDSIAIVDTDDKSGQFLQIVSYLVSTNGDDGMPLMQKAERDTIMAGWK